jgi:ABC-type polysaccharide/polyol phosphate transport system ATPase subunit
MVARLAFSMAAQLQPDILLLDEVLAVGDEHFQRKSYFRMKKLIDKGSLVLIVSHNSVFIEQTCNRAIVLSGGRIVADGEARSVAVRYKNEFSSSYGRFVEL